MRFVGRSAQLAELDAWFRRVVSEERALMLAVRGRRQVGKSRLYTEFIRRTGAPSVFFTAVKDGNSAMQMAAFCRDVASAVPQIPDAAALFASTPSTWTDVFGRLRLAAQQGPIIVVLDELPWAVEADPTLEGELQTAWDRQLSELPVFLILVGSDVAMMERVTRHDRPLFGRAREDEVLAFNPAEVGAALGAGTSSTAAFDAHLATGGYPKLTDDFARAGSIGAYVAAGFSDENSDLVVVAQRSLDAEFPSEAQARRVLSAIGGQAVGHATFSAVVGRMAEDDSASGTALTRALKILGEQKGIVAIETPAAQPAGTKLRRYRITDPYLRFWFRFVEPHIHEVARGRSDLAIAAFDADWLSWRGVAVEPEVQDALWRLAPRVPALEGTTGVSGWWNRDHSVEIDITATRKRAIGALGSIKWRDRRPFGAEELSALATARTVVPGAAAARLVAVCPAGLRRGITVDAAFNADDLLAAWEA